MNNIKKYYLINLTLIAVFILLPLTVLAIIPSTSSFERNNIYDLDGYRNGGYYILRHDSNLTGYMNISHVGGTKEINITSNNIKEVILDFDLMFERRKWLFGWSEITWEEIVASLDKKIIINLNSEDSGIEKLTFIDHPEVKIQVYINGEIYKNWSRLEESEIYTEGFNTGNSEIILEFNIINTLYDYLVPLLKITIIISIIVLVLNLFSNAILNNARKRIK